MRADPPIRADGICALPGCDKLRPTVKPQRGVSIAEYDDPFCCTAHCRAWHLVALPPTGYRDPDEEAA